MSGGISQHDEQLDDALAAFTDHLLDGDGEAHDAQIASPELVALQSVVTHLHATLGRSQPDPTHKARIRSHLQTHWHSQQRKPKFGIPAFSRRQGTRIAVGAMAIFLLAISVALAGGPSSGGQELSGSSAGGQIGSAAALVPMVVAGFMLWWVSRQR